MASNTSPYEYYLNLLGKWPTNIALVSQWIAFFDFSSVNSLVSNFQNILNAYETSGWSYNTDVSKYLIDGKLQNTTQQMMGCVFAREVQLPGETIDVGNQGLSYAGFLPPATAGARTTYQPLTLTLLETNASFLDLIIRPWIISVGYNGLVARKPDSNFYVKSNELNVLMYAKAGPNNPMQIRKQYTFYNVAPISIDGETYSYNEEGLRYANVKFAYDRYTINDGQTGNLINLP
jgi:hypothetical protein